MEKILISWWAYQSDFIDKSETLNKKDSPNYNFHKYFYKNYSKHILLSTANPDDTNSSDHHKFVFLRKQLMDEFPKHTIEGIYIEIKDLLDFKEIKTKTENILLKYKGNQIDIFFSPGNSIMQLAWFICHLSLGLETSLIQMRPSKFTKSKKPELKKLEIEKSEYPFSAILKDLILNERSIETSLSGTGYVGDTLKPVYKKAQKIANTDKISAIIYGETGTGKELVARYIHKNSIRSEMPFEAINCSAFPDSLLESNLFGHEDGAFTDAKKAIGIFKLADKGTIFLDEIGDISPKMQQVLLRVLQEKKIRPILGKEETVDVRVIAATNKNLEKECEKGNFRWDLFYRLSVVDINLPPLRSWPKEEKNELIKHFIEVKKEELNKQIPLEIGKEALNILLTYTYPGNVRQLEHIIESLYVIKDKDNYVVNEVDLAEKYTNREDLKLFRWEDVEKNHIINILRMCKGNKRKANEYIGYKSINTLYNKIKEYNIEESDYDSANVK